MLNYSIGSFPCFSFDDDMVLEDVFQEGGLFFCCLMYYRTRRRYPNAFIIVQKSVALKFLHGLNELRQQDCLYWTYANLLASGGHQEILITVSR